MLLNLILLLYIASVNTNASLMARTNEILKEYKSDDLYTPEDSSTLILSHIIFRHGDRTPDRAPTYLSDPYRNFTYPPYGHGQLTLRGKQVCYNLGKYLRRRYDSFLEPTFVLNEVHAQTSAYDRTKMCTLSVLTGLFPPEINEKLETNLNWQPVPYDYSKTMEDHIIFNNFECEHFTQLIQEEEDDLKDELKKYDTLFKYLSESTGFAIKTVAAAMIIHDTLKTQDEFGLLLPAWTKKVYPQPLHNVTIKFWEIESATIELRKLVVGNLLKKILADSESKLNGSNSNQAKKLYLYGAHDVNLVPILRVFNSWRHEIVPYAAFILFELHKVNDIYGFKVFYQNYETLKPTILNIPNCGAFCPLENFKHVLKNYTLSSDTICQSS